MPETELRPNIPPEILPRAVARRRLLIYVFIRLAGIALAFVGLSLAQRGVGVVSVLLLVLGAASLFLRPKMLGRALGSRW